MRKFRIYYGDGSTYSGDPFEAPQTDVQLITQENPETERGWAIVFGKTLSGYYCWREGAWFITDDAGFWDYLMCCPGPKKVLFGRSILRTATFNEMFQRAKAEGLGDDP